MSQKSIKKNSIYSIIKTGSTIIFPLITFPYISRVLLTENVGKINFGLSIVSYFNLVASLGITTYAIRECSRVREDKKELSDTASQVFSINIVTTCIAYLLLFVALLLFRKLDDYRILIVIQSMSIVSTTLGADWINSAMEDFKYITIRTVFFQLFALLSMILFVHHPGDYIKYAVICLISSAGANIVNIWYRKRFCVIRFTVKIDWKRHMKPIIYLFVMILAQTIFNSVDSTMLGLIHGDYEVGIYSAAHKITNIINQVVGSLLWVIMPRMTYYFAENNFEGVNKLLRKVLGFNVLFGLPCATGCIVMAEDIICIAAGKSYIEAAPVLRILMIGFLLSLIGGNFLGNAILLPSKQEKYYMIVCCITAIVNIVTNYCFIPLYGTMAAAGTTAVCSLLIAILLMFKIDKRIRVEKIGRVILAPLVGCCCIVLTCMICKKIDSLGIRVIISLIGSMGVYGLIQIIMKNELVIEVIKLVYKKRDNIA